MLGALQRFFHTQPASQVEQSANQTVKKGVPPMAEEKIQQIYKQSVESIMKAKGVTREVAEAEVNNLC